MTLRPLVVGVQDRRSVDTVAWAADAAASIGTSVVVVHVVPWAPCPEGFGAWLPLDEAAHLEPWVDARFGDPMRLRGVPYSVRVVTGPVVAALRAVADAEQAAAIVVGVRNRRWWRRRRLAVTVRSAVGRPVFAVPHTGDRLEAWLATVGAERATIDD